ncbi:MAG: HesA/MoeB/ThiF family protein, partial [Planctomycetes bacterium]|nr:HesA/MoeB/ThiF family protein [Planctomycetota bacterium]
NDHEVERYSRHILLPQVGAKGQARLRASNVLVIGAGGLGSPLLLYLAAAGVGRITIADGDAVDRSNLQRQIAHGEADIGVNKARSAAQSIAALNPDCRVEVVEARFDINNAAELLAGRDLVLDGSDNFSTRYLVNDAAFLNQVPLISASVFRFEGQLATFTFAPNTPCYRCVFPEPPPAGSVPSCAEAGVLGAVVGTLGTMQASEAILTLAGVREPRVGSLIRYDALAMRLDSFEVEHNPECKLCGGAPVIVALEQTNDPACGVADNHLSGVRDV